MIVSDIKRVNSLLQYIQNVVTKHDRIYASLDFEFDMVNRGHQLALGQMILTYDVGKKNEKLQTSRAYLMDFRLFSKKQFRQFKNNLLLNPKVTKILHGSESLDLPAIRKLLSSDSEFSAFLNQMVDTRYLCEAHHILLRKSKGIYLKKCSIYDALKDTKVITKEQYDQLSGIKINYHKPWRIRRLSKKQVRYAVADVVFLYNLYIEYRRLLGDKVIEVVMEAYRFSVLTRMGLVPLPYQNRKTLDLMEKLEEQDILQKSVAKSPIGDFTIGDIVEIEYLKKSAIRIAYDTYIE